MPPVPHLAAWWKPGLSGGRRSQPELATCEGSSPLLAGDGRKVDGPRDPRAPRSETEASFSQVEEP